MYLDTGIATNREPPSESLGDILRRLKRESGLTLADLTVLSPCNDPFRLDTPTGHINGRWLRDTMSALGQLGRKRHNRGVHYTIVSADKPIKRPDGKRYVNDEPCWSFLEDKASKCARWLGYVPFDDISDARNDEPALCVSHQEENDCGFYMPTATTVPELEEFKPSLYVEGYAKRQPFRVVLWGEKTSLREVLDPIRARFDTDLYLQSGEISDTRLYQMARIGNEDRREMVVFAFTDCDPAGYQMAVSIAHKLRAHKEREFPRLRFRVYTPALTVEQVRALELPSTPLKESEKRASGWRKRYGVEQTEIDALATLRPNVLRQIAEDAIRPFRDVSLAHRTEQAHNAWRREAGNRLREALAETNHAALMTSLEASLETVRERAGAVRSLLSDIEVEWPGVVVPEPIIAEDAPPPLVSSEMELIEAIQILKARKNYSEAA